MIRGCALHLDHRHRRRLDGAEVGQQVGLARGAQQLLALVAADLGEDVDRGGHIGSRAVSSRSERPVTRPDGSLKAFIELPFALHANQPLWVPPLEARALGVPEPAPERVLQPRRGRVLPRLARRAGRRAASAPRSTTPSTSTRRRTGAGSASSSSRTTRRWRGRCSRAAEGWLRERGRERMVGSGGLHDERRERRADRGLRAAPMILQPWHPPYYQRLMEQAGMGKAMDLLMWNLRGDRPREGAAGDLGAGGEGRVRARDRVRPMRQQAAAQGHGLRSPRSTTPPGRTTGTSCRYSKKELDAYAQEIQLVFDKHWA